MQTERPREKHGTGYSVIRVKETTKARGLPAHARNPDSNWG